MPSQLIVCTNSMIRRNILEQCNVSMGLAEKRAGHHDSKRSFEYLIIKF